MLLHSVFTVVTSDNKLLADIKPPFIIQLDTGVQTSLVKHGDGLRLLIDRKIDSTKIELVKNSGLYRKLPNGKQVELPTVRIRNDKTPENILAQDFISGLAFLTNAAFTLSRPPHEDRFVPETDEDRKIIASFGTDKPYGRISGQVSMRSFSTGVTADRITRLMPRRVGLRLYANAVKANFAVAQFRELWRVLESAFAKDGSKLVALLAAYPPAKELGFKQAELRKLCILRGRASHAQSSSGLEELVSVDRECTERLPRLKNLCERVILTKKSWGYPTLAIDEVTPLNGFIGKDNSIVIIQTK